MLLVETPRELPRISCGLATYVEQAAGEKSKPSSRKVCFSFAAYAKNVINHMKKCHIPIAEGLTDEEFSNIESTFGFTFPPDLEAILQEGLPVGNGFPHWRNSSRAEIRSWLNLPIKALCNEVKSGKLWPSQWGVRPDQVVNAVRTAANELKRVPTLVPVYANCYISCFPIQAGNPVFLVQESTILYCGYDLADFFKRQAFVPQSGSTSESPLFELHSGITLIKEQINLQRHALEGANSGSKITYSTGTPDEFKMSLSTAMWRWADESPRIPIDTLNKEATSNHRYQHVKGDPSSLVTPSPPPPPPPTPSPSLSSSSSSSSSPSSRKNSSFAATHGKSFSSSSTNSSSSSSPSSRNGHEDPRMGIICKKYLYFHEKPLPSRMLNKFTMAAPPWVAKQARKITFWSDVAEGYWLQPESSSDAATPCIHQSHADFRSESAQGHQKCNSTYHAVESSDGINNAKYLQFTDYLVSGEKSSHQHNSFERQQLSIKSSHDFATEKRLDGMQQKYDHSGGESSDEFSLEEDFSGDEHDYIIHNQPAKRSRSNYAVVEQTSSDTIDYLSLKADKGTHHDLPASNSHREKLNGQHPKMIRIKCSDSCKRHSNEWLSAYLNGLADALRRGKWCEADINDMLLQYTPEKANGARLYSCLP
ncbi:hypothetical protein L7F22_052388 [Adiantum nelumboides]|nr:hypothetical protein [Adiantum nelumboides]